MRRGAGPGGGSVSRRRRGSAHQVCTPGVCGPWGGWFPIGFFFPRAPSAAESRQVAGPRPPGRPPGAGESAATRRLEAERVHRAWDEGGARLPVAKVRALAAEIGIEDAEAARRTDALLRLLPGLESKVMTMQVKALGALVRDLRAVCSAELRPKGQREAWPRRSGTPGDAEGPQ